MKHTGWRFFWSLLLADIVGVVASFLGLVGWRIWMLVAIVFVLFAIVLTVIAIAGSRRKAKQLDSPEETKNQN